MTLIRPVVADFTDWCESSFLDINVSKTKDMIIDFRKNKNVISPVFINDQAVEVVEEYKYLGTIIDNRLSFDKRGHYARQLTDGCIFIAN